MEMLRFISFQGSRTEKAKMLSDDFISKMFEKVVKPMMKADKELMKKVTEQDLDKVKLVYPGAFLYGVVHSLESNILLTDLVPAVIINKTEQEFIFSDNPVIFYNLIYNIYYKSENQKSSVEDLSRDYFSEYSKDKDLAQIKEVPKWNGGNNSLLVSSKKGIPEKVSLRFIECGKPLRKVAVIRNKELNDLFEERMKLYGFERGDYKNESN